MLSHLWYTTGDIVLSVPHLWSHCQIRKALQVRIPIEYLNEYVVEHYSDVIMSAIASQITGVRIAHLTICSGADQGKHQSYSSLAFVRIIHRWPMNSPHKGPVTRKMFPFDDGLYGIYIYLSDGWCHESHTFLAIYALTPHRAKMLTAKYISQIHYPYISITQIFPNIKHILWMKKISRFYNNQFIKFNNLSIDFQYGHPFKTQKVFRYSGCPWYVWMSIMVARPALSAYFHVLM